ncbi:hypothetical protein [Actinomadura sp. NPDC048394]|uniref:hypothetical protein n=1 Tax=Actinomadura sp. NPDC048394 TaxID=3158223 RepID=UPI0033C293A2
MSVLQKWLSGLIGLGALYLVVTNPNGVYKAATGLRQLIGGTEADVISGGKR